MKVKFLKSMLVALTLLFTIFLVEASAKPSIQTETLQAELFGDYDLESSELITVIVELNEKSIVEAKHAGKVQTKENLKTTRQNIIDEVGSQTNASVEREYDYVFSGFSIEIPENELMTLLSISGIKAVYPNIRYTTNQVGEPNIIPTDAYSPTMVDSAPFMGANAAWDLGYTGKGITVAVIDTGVDYTHPDLAHAFGDYKGYDFVDDDFDPMEVAGEYHGTHVSGTIAANGLIKGVAPEATLLGYRVLGPDGGTSEDVIAGIELAVQDGADVMNLSLGNTLNSADYATSIALDWAMAEGVVAVTSNGNSGPLNWTVGSPGASRQAISVGATELPHIAYNAGISTSSEVTYSSSKVGGLTNTEDLLALDGETYEFVYAGLGSVEEFATIDVEGKVALISRGQLAFTDKALNAKNAGAVAVILFNNVPGEIGSITPVLLPTILLSLEDGQLILNELASGNNEVTFDVVAEHLPETMASFSSRGPAAGTWMIKPDVVAPGVNILSTYPGGGYTLLNGTSMASPHVAGAAALILEAHPNWDVDDVKAALMNSAETIIDPLTGKAYPHNDQGAGSIRVDKAIEVETLVIPGSYSFGTFLKDNGKQVEHQSFEIKNLSNEGANYSFEIVFEGSPNGISVSTSNNNRVHANSSKQINLKVQVDASILEPGYYPGTILVNDGTKVIEVPTILFISEPDYPRITHGGIYEENGETMLEVFLPGGADRVDLVVYSDSPWGYAGEQLLFTDVASGLYATTWDGKLNGQSLLPAVYHAYIFAEKAGVTDYIYGGAFMVTATGDILTSLTGGLSTNDEGEAIVSLFTPIDVLAVYLVIYSDTPFAYAGEETILTNLYAGYYEYVWDGTLVGESLTPGIYHAYIFTETAEAQDYVYGGAFEVTETGEIVILN